MLSVSSARAANPASYGGATADGSEVFFTSRDRLVVGDTDNFADVFARSYDPDVNGGDGAYVTREISSGPTGGNDAYNASFAAVATDGDGVTRVFFDTDEALVAGDKDRRADVYARDLSTGQTILVSQGAGSCAPACGNGSFDSEFAGIGAGGERIFFTTSEQDAAGDEDSSSDIYVRDLGTTPATTALVSAAAPECASACGDAEVPASFQGASSDGSRVYFTTAQRMTSGDTDDLRDVYRRDIGTGTTALASGAGTCPTGTNCDASFAGATSDGSHVYFETSEQIGAGDTDSLSDVYDWSGGTPVLVSQGPDPSCPGQDCNATFAGASSDGAHVFFQTPESLVTADDDNGAQDIYDHSGGATTLISTSPSDPGTIQTAASFDRASPDGSTVVFDTAQALVAADADAKRDVYERSTAVGAMPTLVSIAPDGGSGAFAADFAGATGDLGQIYFGTPEQMLAPDDDIDSSIDIYERKGGVTSLVSGSPMSGGDYDADFRAVSADGSHAFFQTNEELTAEDTDDQTDVYERAGGETRLVSAANPDSIVLGPDVPVLTGTDPTSPGQSTTPAVLGSADVGTAIKIYDTADCSGAPVGLGTSNDLGGAGIQVEVEEGSTSDFHATATDSNGDTSACSAGVSYTQQSAPPPPPGGGDGGGGGGGSQPPVAGGSPPAAPTLSSTNPASPANMNQPGVRGIAVAGAVVRIYAGGACMGAPAAVGTAAGLEAGGLPVLVPDNSTTTLRATASVGGLTSACSRPLVYVEDSTAPHTRITFGPGVKTRSKHPVFRFTDVTGDLGTTFLCRVDRRRWRRCSPPQRLRRLRRGRRHTFRVKAIDAAGNRERKAAKRRFKVVGRRHRGHGRHIHRRTHRHHTRSGR